MGSLWRFPRKIYAIQHNVTKKIYIGSSQNVDNRYQSHIASLRANRHHVEDMQQDFNDYGEDYSLFILDEMTNHKDRIKEFEWMQKYNSWERGVGYNYKDSIAKMNVLKNRKPYVEGVPETSLFDAKDNLHSFIETLTESQVAYSYTLLLELFGGK